MGWFRCARRVIERRTVSHQPCGFSPNRHASLRSSLRDLDDGTRTRNRRHLTALRSTCSPRSLGDAPPARRDGRALRPRAGAARGGGGGQIANARPIAAVTRRGGRHRAAAAAAAASRPSLRGLRWDLPAAVAPPPPPPPPPLSLRERLDADADAVLQPAEGTRSSRRRKRPSGRRRARRARPSASGGRAGEDRLAAAAVGAGARRAVDGAVRQGDRRRPMVPGRRRPFMNSVSPSVSNHKSAHSLSEDVVVKVDETSALTCARRRRNVARARCARRSVRRPRELGVDRVAVQVLLHLEGVLTLHPLAHRARLGEEGGQVWSAAAKRAAGRGCGRERRGRRRRGAS